MSKPRRIMGEVVNFARQGASMPENAPVPIPPASKPDVTAAYSIHQVTQVNNEVPSHVWTPEVLEKLHERQHDIEIRRQSDFAAHKEREDRNGLIGLGLIGAIIAV